MLFRIAFAGLLLYATAGAAIVDRIAIVAGSRVIKDSDIEREIRVIDFINGENLDFSPAARKKAADRLVEQALLRREIETGRYPAANADEVDKFLAQMRHQRFPSDAAYQAALDRYGITEDQLKKHLAWQLTVLHFIEQRFRAGIPEKEQTGARINQQFYAWLDQARKQTRIEYHEEALR